MKALSIWMKGVGIFYIINLVLLWPSLWGPQVHIMYPGVELYRGEPIFQMLLDAWLIVGLGLASIGVVLLVASGNPARYYAGLIPVVLITEFVFGIWDIYSAMGYEELWVAMVTLVVHIIIIIPGIIIWRNVSSAES